MPFSFKTLGALAAIGRRTGVAGIFGINFSGFLAWFLWRGIYWSKLPRLEKKVRVAIDWALDVLFTKDFVQFLDQRALAHTQTETGTALWNREHLSTPARIENRAAA
jgi:NADH dehydrogenase